MPVLSKKGSSKVCRWICSIWSSWVWESQHASTWNSVSWSLGHRSRSSFHRRATKTAGSELIGSTISLVSWQRLSFWSSLRSLGKKLRENLPYLQFLANNCVYNFHTDIKLCTYCLYRLTAVLIHEILYLANQLWCSDFFTPPTPLIIPDRLLAFLNLLWLSKADAQYMQDDPKAFWSIPYVSVVFFPSLKQFLLHIVLLKCPHVQIAFLKFTSCHTQALVGYIPIPDVAVHFKLKL